MAAPKNPAGAKSDKLWRDAIHRAVKRSADDKTKKLERLADKLVARGLEGDVSALKEIGDRLDGKAAQRVEGAGSGGEHVLKVVFGDK